MTTIRQKKTPPQPRRGSQEGKTRCPIGLIRVYPKVRPIASQKGQDRLTTCGPVTLSDHGTSAGSRTKKSLNGGTAGHVTIRGIITAAAQVAMVTMTPVARAVR
jgi:hypothetical protein